MRRSEKEKGIEATGEGRFDPFSLRKESDESGFSIG
jgi:hypothetical protein